MTPTIREFVLAIGSSLPASVVVKATVIVAFGLMGARIARRSRAAVRHVLLAATFGVLLLLPVASLIVPPVRIAVPIVRQNDTVLPPLDGATDSIPSFTRPDPHSAVKPPNWWFSSPSPFALLIMGWFVGTVLSLIPMIVGLRNLRLLRRSGLPWTDGQAVADSLALKTGIRRPVEVLLHEALPGPIASGMLHPGILLPRDAQNWESGDLNRAFLHELEHVRRGDAVSQCLARAACAVYWFHPLVWTACRQLGLEAERSCDDAVMARSEATAYADQLVGLARRLSMAAKSPLLGMANRADLAIRVGAVLDGRQRRGRAGPFLVALGCAAAAVLVLTISPLRTVSAPQSSSAQTVAGSSPAIGAGAPLPSFEVASIKPNHSADLWTRFDTPKGRFIATSITAKELIKWAYAGISLPLRDDQLSGGPSWISSERYDIDARLDNSHVEPLEKLPPEQRILQIRRRVQSLLADRFKLVVRDETKEIPVYALVIAKNGPKLRKAKPGDTYPNGIKGPDGRSHPGMWWVEGGKLTGQALPIASLVMILSQSCQLELGRTVLDQTGLKGKYDIALKWTPDQSSAGMFMGTFGVKPRAESIPPPDSSGPSIFTAIQEQLGLKLESTKGPAEAIVIDHIERPTAN